jgi:hypothetical protein
MAKCTDIYEVDLMLAVATDGQIMADKLTAAKLHMPDL